MLSPVRLEGTKMTTEPTTHLIEELRRTLDHMSADLDRIETLTCALYGFTQPVPDYEPNFQHFSGVRMSAHEIRNSD